MYQMYKDQGFIILNVLFQNKNRGRTTQADIQDWVNTYGITFPVLNDHDRTVWEMYDEEGYIPLNILIDQEMVIQYKATGYSENALKIRIEALLDNPPD